MLPLGRSNIENYHSRECEHLVYHSKWFFMGIKIKWNLLWMKEREREEKFILRLFTYIFDVFRAKSARYRGNSWKRGFYFISFVHIFMVVAFRQHKIEWRMFTKTRTHQPYGYLYAVVIPGLLVWIFIPSSFHCLNFWIFILSFTETNGWFSNGCSE